MYDGEVNVLVRFQITLYDETLIIALFFSYSSSAKSRIFANVLDN